VEAVRERFDDPVLSETDDIGSAVVIDVGDKPRPRPDPDAGLEPQPQA